MSSELNSRLYILIAPPPTSSPRTAGGGSRWGGGKTCPTGSWGILEGLVARGEKRRWVLIRHDDFRGGEAVETLDSACGRVSADIFGVYNTSNVKFGKFLAERYGIKGIARGSRNR